MIPNRPAVIFNDADEQSFQTTKGQNTVDLKWMEAPLVDNHPDAEILRVALDQKLASNIKQEILLRISIWRRDNDRFRDCHTSHEREWARKLAEEFGDESEEESAKRFQLRDKLDSTFEIDSHLNDSLSAYLEEVRYIRGVLSSPLPEALFRQASLSQELTRMQDNLVILIELLDESNSKERLYKAEALRELGHFQRSLDLLQVPTEEDFVFFQNKIAELSRQGERCVAELTAHE